MVITNKLGITDSPTLAREEERISKKAAARLFQQNLLNNMPRVLGLHYKTSIRYYFKIYMILLVSYVL